MFWVDDIIEQSKNRFSQKIAAKQPLIIRDEKTASGRVHVGSLRGVAIHGAVYEALKEKGISAKYLFEINDFDPMDGIPVYLDQKEYSQYLGKPLCTVPSPDPKASGDRAKNFAEYYGGEFVDVIHELGFDVELYRSSEMYKTGKYNESIKLALTRAADIRRIYKEVSGSVRESNWWPVQMICEHCGKVSTTKVTGFKEQEDDLLVDYTCTNLDWTNGCGYSGTRSPYNGNAKLPWKVEWAAKFKVIGVDVEGAGKDHSTKGGSRDVSEHIAREVFHVEPPINIPYEFFNVGGKKMSSSKGAGSSSREMADLLPPHILRLLLLQKVPQRTIDFIPDGDTVPILYDNYDKLATAYFADPNNPDAHIFRSIHFPAIKQLMDARFLPRFSQVAYLVQMPHIDVEAEVCKEKGADLNSADHAEIKLRKTYAKRWLDTYAPEDYKFDLKETLPEVAKNLSEGQKGALKQILAYIQSQTILDGQELHTQLHEIRKASGVEPKQFFEALYLSFLGKGSGPKAGWFVSVLDREFVEKRLEEASK